jgi:hypothetical protein
MNSKRNQGRSERGEKTFPSKSACDFAVQFWKDKWNANIGTADLARDFGGFIHGVCF